MAKLTALYVNISINKVNLNKIYNRKVEECNSILVKY